MSGPTTCTRWDDDELVRALRAPGTASELAGEERYVAAYRSTRTSRGPNVSPLRRGVRRLGAGGTTVVAVVALSSGVAAAAYTRHLPEPVQRVAHQVLGAPAPVGSRRRPDPREAGPFDRAGRAHLLGDTPRRRRPAPRPHPPGDRRRPSAAPNHQHPRRTHGQRRPRHPRARRPRPAAPTPTPTTPVPHDAAPRHPNRPRVTVRPPATALIPAPR